MSPQFGNVGVGFGFRLFTRPEGPPAFSGSDYLVLSPGGKVNQGQPNNMDFYQAPGVYRVTLLDWTALTSINLTTESPPPPSANICMDRLYLSEALPQLTSLQFIVGTQFVGASIEDWTFPTGFVTLTLRNTRNLSYPGSGLTGNLDAAWWARQPQTLQIFDVTSADLTGDVTAWVLPRDLRSLSLYNQSGSDGNNQFTGDCSQWRMTAAQHTFWSVTISGQQIDYATSDGLLANTTKRSTLNAQDMPTWTQATVDRVLADARLGEERTPGKDGSLFLTGTTPAPSAQGAADAAWLVANGWNVFTS